MSHYRVLFDGGREGRGGGAARRLAQRMPGWGMGRFLIFFRSPAAVHRDVRIKKFDHVLQLPLALLEVAHRLQGAGLVAGEPPLDRFLPVDAYGPPQVVAQVVRSGASMHIDQRAELAPDVAVESGNQSVEQASPDELVRRVRELLAA